MPRPRREAQRQATADEIKTIARTQMREKGTVGLSLRAIAREMGVTAPAIYNYFPSLDDLITALIVDAFKAHADAIEGAAQIEGSIRERFGAALHAYRDWATANAADFQLIYGNPIPGYEAPADVTIPLAARPLAFMTRMLYEASESDGVSISMSYTTLPETNLHHLKRIIAQFTEITVPPELLYMVMVAVTRIQGIVMLEIFEHLGPTVGSVDDFFAHEVAVILDMLGLI